MAIAKKKKRFYDVKIPLIGKTTQLRSFEVKELEGRYLQYDMTRLLRGKNSLLQLKVSVKDKEAVANPRTFRILPYHIRRMVRKGTNYVEDSFSTECLNAQIRLKPFLVTRKKVSRKVRKALRDMARKELIKYASKNVADKIFDDILKNKLQKELSLKLKKVYPLSSCEMRVIRIEKDLEMKEKPKSEKKKVEKETKEVKEEKPTKKKVVKKKIDKKTEKEETKKE